MLLKVEPLLSFSILHILKFIFVCNKKILLESIYFFKQWRNAWVPRKSSAWKRKRIRRKNKRIWNVEFRKSHSITSLLLNLLMFVNLNLFFILLNSIVCIFVYLNKKNFSQNLPIHKIFIFVIIPITSLFIVLNLNLNIQFFSF